MKRHYDVVVLGASVGALTCAALLAKRSWRVLVLGHDYRPPVYRFDGLPLARRPFTMLAASSPVWTRVVVELAQSQRFQRRLMPLDPMFQVLLPGARFELPPDLEWFKRELEREFYDAARNIDEAYTELSRTNAAADAAFERDVVWPPGGFWERRETARIVSALPQLTTDAHPFSVLPEGHAYRSVVDASVAFATDSGDALPPFAAARLHGSWTRGVYALPGGETELIDFLVERIRAHGGDVRLTDRASELLVRSGKVHAIMIDGEDMPNGVQFVIGDVPVRQLMDLAPKFSVSKRTQQGMPQVYSKNERFVVSLLVRNEGVPAALGREAFITSPEDPTLPPVHVQRWDGAQIESELHTLLVCETFVDERLPASMARSSVLAAVEAYLPFIERHYVFVDSPHDGEPLWDYRSGARVAVPRARLRAEGGSLEAEPMDSRWTVDPATLHGLAGEPLRTPLGNGFVIGSTVMPALGQEGRLLAAWSVARIITRTDRRKEKMRREMWSKVELG